MTDLPFPLTLMIKFIPNICSILLKRRIINFTVLPSMNNLRYVKIYPECLPRVGRALYSVSECKRFNTIHRIFQLSIGISNIHSIYRGI